MAVPLLLGAAKGLLANTAKNAVKKKALGAAKDFVSGKNKKEKGGALVKRETVGGSQRRTKARVKATQTYTGGSVSSGSSTIKAKVTPGGEVSYEKLTEQLNNMVGVSNALNKAIKNQYKKKDKQANKKKNERTKTKRQAREEELESKKNPTKRFGILAGVGAAGSKFGIFNFLLNTLLGGLATLFINNFGAIEEFFSGLGEAFNNKMNLLRWGLTALRGPIQLAAITVAKVFKPVLKRLGPALGRGLKGMGNNVANGLRGIGNGVYNFAKNLSSKFKGAASGATKTVVSSGTRGAANAGASSATKAVTKTATKATERRFTTEGAKRLLKFSKAFKKVPLVGPLIGVGIDLAMGETLDRAIVGAIGAQIGTTIGGFIGQGLIPIPFLGAGVGMLVGAGIGDYLAKELYNNIAKNLVGDGLSPLGEKKEEPEKPIKPEGSTRTVSSPPPVTVSGGGSDFWTLVAVASLEDSDGQGRADVAQSIYNRSASGAYGGGTKNIRDLILGKLQYQPTWDYPRKNGNGYGNPNNEWYNIVDAQTAAAATGKSIAFIEQAARDIMDPTLQKNAREFVGGRTDFTNYSSERRRGEIYRSTGGKNNYFGWDWNYNGNVQGKMPDFGAAQSNSSRSTSMPLSPSSSSETSSGDMTVMIPSLSLPESQPFSKASSRAQRVQQRASYEGAGSQVVTVPIPAGGQQQMMVGGNRSGSVVMGGSTRAMVNSYYKAQLMGFLYKQG